MVQGLSLKRGVVMSHKPPSESTTGHQRTIMGLFTAVTAMLLALPPILALTVP